MIVPFLLVNSSEALIQRKIQIHSLQGLLRIYFPGLIFDNHSSLAVEHRHHRQPVFFGVRQLLFPRRRNAAKLSAAGDETNVYGKEQTNEIYCPNGFRGFLIAVHLRLPRPFYWHGA